MVVTNQSVVCAIQCCEVYEEDDGSVVEVIFLMSLGHCHRVGQLGWDMNKGEGWKVGLYRNDRVRFPSA